MQPVLSLFRDDFDCIIELGAGYGRNLFILDKILNQPKVKYHSAEYTKSGRELSEMLATKFMPKMNFKTHFLDHKEPDFSFLKDSKKALIFSCHSIEQVPKTPNDYYEKLARSGPEITGIHLEPFGFQMEEETDILDPHHQFSLERKFNLNLYKTLKNSNKLNIINLHSCKRDIAFTQAEKPTSIAIWDNKTQST